MQWDAALRCFSESELRHVQRNWRVSVHSPLRYLPNPNFVIVGEPTKVRRAKAYMERMGWAAWEHIPRCQQLGWDAVDNWGVSDEADDFWGDEDELDDCLKPYMYSGRLDWIE